MPHIISNLRRKITIFLCRLYKVAIQNLPPRIARKRANIKGLRFTCSASASHASHCSPLILGGFGLASHTPCGVLFAPSSPTILHPLRFPTRASRLSEWLAGLSQPVTISTSSRPPPPPHCSATKKDFFAMGGCHGSQVVVRFRHPEGKIGSARVCPAENPGSWWFEVLTLKTVWLQC